MAQGKQRQPEHSCTLFPSPCSPHVPRIGRGFGLELLQQLYTDRRVPLNNGYFPGAVSPIPHRVSLAEQTICFISLGLSIIKSHLKRKKKKRKGEKYQSKHVKSFFLSFFHFFINFYFFPPLLIFFLSSRYSHCNYCSLMVDRSIQMLHYINGPFLSPVQLLTALVPPTSTSFPFWLFNCILLWEIYLMLRKSEYFTT